MADRDTGTLSKSYSIALLLTLGWLGLMAWVFLGATAEDPDGTRANVLRSLIATLGVALPVALIWIGAIALHTAQALKHKTLELQAALNALQARSQTDQEQRITALRTEIDTQLAELSLSQKALQGELASLLKPQAISASPAAAEPRSKATPQPVLAFEPDMSDPPQPLPAEDFIRAMNFPDNEQDTEGFRVLRAALDHHPTAELVKAAQDVLTLLSQDGIYMDDLAPHRPLPVLWRAFAVGTRGDTIAGLAGIRDRSSIALTAGRLKEDPVFRDATHQFLRLFDRVFASFAETATDEEIIRFSDTRTARAFMLLGRVAGSFG